MRNKLTAARAVAWLLGGATFASAGNALAADCQPGTSTTVYVSGSSAIQPLLQAVADVLGSAITIAYQKPGSCEGLGYVLNSGTKDADTEYTLVPSGTATSCTPAAGTGATVDIGLSDVYASTCKNNFDSTLPDVGTGMHDFLGPVQAMTFAVPTASTENIISAEAAYMVFGFAAASMDKTIAPWSQPGDIYVRYFDSGTLEMLGVAIGLNGSKWVNAKMKTGSPQVATGTGNMVTLLSQSGMVSGHASSTIGIVSTSGLVAPMGMTSNIKALAFQGKDQSCSYYPDATSSSFDKINVRQGRYEVWGPEHLVAHVDGSGNPVGMNGNTAAVQTLINALTATSQALPTQSDAGAGDGGVTSLSEGNVAQIIAAISKPSVGFIPTCAMQVQRTEEEGAESSYAPPAACSCAFEQATSMLTGHTCTPCTAQNAATVCTGATPACHFGYCEAQ